LRACYNARPDPFFDPFSRRAGSKPVPQQQLQTVTAPMQRFDTRGMLARMDRDSQYDLRQFFMYLKPLDPKMWGGR